MKAPKTVRRIIETLATQHPNADTELHYRTAFELLVATILSAQSTDERVNMVTPALFDRYPDARALAGASPRELEPLILSTGFFRQKSKSLIGMASQLVADHGGQVPADMEKLTQLPGVGRKTANVVLGHALGVPGLPVDRHVLRVSNRIGIAEGDDPEDVEAQLCGALPKEMWTLASDVQILHGRRVCRPNPLCDQCSIRAECDYYEHVVVKERGPATAGARARKAPAARKGAAPRSTQAGHRGRRGRV
jgi:endonuclease-3